MTIKEANRLHVMKEIEDGRISIQGAANKLRLSYKQVRRIWTRYLKEGAEGIISRRVGQKPGNMIPEEMRLNILIHLKEKYYDFKPTFASEKLAELEGIRVSREWLRKFMISQGLWEANKSKRKKIYRSRDRRRREGELEQIDGSYHAWFEERGEKCCLLVIVDDATSKIMGLRFCKHETTIDYLELLKEYFHKHGIPQAFYSDKHQIFRVNNGKGTTQLGRTLRELGVELICANSPQAKGRVERKNAVLQDRLIKEMRLRGIKTIEEANRFVSQEFVKTHNARFSKEPDLKENVHLPSPAKDELEHVLAIKEKRKVSKNLTLQYKNEEYQIHVEGHGYRMIGATVDVIEREGDISLEYKGQKLKYTRWRDNAFPGEIMDRKHIQAFLDRKRPMTIIERHRKKKAMNF